MGENGENQQRKCRKPKKIDEEEARQTAHHGIDNDVQDERCTESYGT